ncbi:two-component system, OmpR family, response regulator YxdJ [Marininema mesophilum]|uniref:Two-component system, OmpR family, response regulator YxdJ n=1 Tax=Marininema mesophilum TaxID=1048340 RepID=A0A1H2QX93_9BACL|nr:response regulator transcription factor [Marininema mesophilum]SDW11548.1 two-component system, OmpR family, response regulator YxdJ [Marininema mesophilum]
MFTIMIVEDDPKINQLLQSHIEKYGYQAIDTTDFEKVYQQFQENQPDLVLLDVNLPKFDGYYWCRQIRSVSTCPILFISAREGKMEQVMALENGADDYIPKPFHYEIVMAKIRSHLRRAYGSYASTEGERKVEASGLTLYPERMEASLEGKEIELSHKEVILLEALMERQMRVVSRDRLLEKLWDDQHFIDDNTLNVNVTRLRKKLRDLGIGDCIETVRGAGYMLKVTWRKSR